MFSLKSGQFEIKDGEVLLVLMKMALKSCTIGNAISQLVLVGTLCWNEKAIKILILGFQEVTALFVHRKTNDFPTS